jgi:hypothetical protein
LLRQQQAQVSTPKQIKREMDENNKDAIIASQPLRMSWVIIELNYPSLQR